MAHQFFFGFGLGIISGFIFSQYDYNTRIKRNKEKFFKQKKIIQNYKDFVESNNLSMEFVKFNNLNKYNKLEEKKLK